MVEIRNAVSTDKLLLEEMYIEEVEPHLDRAKAFAEQLTDRFRTILAFHDNSLCGTVTWDVRGGLDDGVAEIIGLGVNEAFRREGIATKLVNHFLIEASEFYKKNGYNLRVVMLFMEKSNNGARQFYKKLGFLEQSIIPNLYPGDDGVIWVKHV